MMRSRSLCFLFAWILIPTLNAVEPKTVSPFTLKDPLTQKMVSFKEFKDSKGIVVVFLGTECPINNFYLPVLAKMHKDFHDKGIGFLGINSNSQDTPTEIAAHARKYQVPFPILADVGNKVADDFQAERTPEAYLLSAKGVILYRGRIDDRYGIDYQRPDQPRKLDLVNAIKDTLAGKPVSVVRTKVDGCVIGRNVQVKKDGEITFYRDILPILQNNCQECHREGQIGPMPLKEYKDVVAWSGMIDEVVRERRMPPWFADPKHGKFSNDRRLPTKDRDTLLKWIDSGMAKGNVKERPEPKTFVKGWRIGKPDLVIEMPKAFKVPAEMPPGGVPYKYFTVPTNFKEDRWVVAAEALPGAAPVVHHIIVFIVPPGKWFNPDRPGATLCGTAPGDMPTRVPKGFAKLVPKGSKLVFQMHYTPNGKEYMDRSKIGLIFAKEKPKYTAMTKPIIPRKFIFRADSIPAGDSNYKMEVSYTLRRKTKLINLLPHMHLRGKSFKYEAITPDGKREVLLNIPEYNFNWQSIYRLAEPKTFPKGTKIHCTAHFDNSEDNLNNPDASKPVYWGDQTWQEMMIGWIDFAYID